MSEPGWILATKDLSAALQSLVTAASFIIAGWWAYKRFIREDERYPHLQSSAELRIVGRQAGSVIVEVVAILENKGRVVYDVLSLTFDLRMLRRDEAVQTSSAHGGQAYMVWPLAAGSFLTEKVRHCYVSPGVVSRYSWIAKVPESASILNVHCTFGCGDRPDIYHTMEATIAVPPAEQLPRIDPA